MKCREEDGSAVRVRARARARVEELVKGRERRKRERPEISFHLNDIMSPRAHLAQCGESVNMTLLDLHGVHTCITPVPVHNECNMLRYGSSS